MPKSVILATPWPSVIGLDVAMDDWSAATLVEVLESPPRAMATADSACHRHGGRFSWFKRKLRSDPPGMNLNTSIRWLSLVVLAVADHAEEVSVVDLPDGLHQLLLAVLVRGDELLHRDLDPV
jgi:hypothetical protein